jgi:uncharacterized protein YjbI with pentapeptide repeats
MKNMRQDLKPPDPNRHRPKWWHPFFPLIMAIKQRTAKLQIRLRQLGQLPWGALIILIAVAALSTGWSVYRTGDWPGFALNFGTEMAGAIVTYVLLEVVIGTRQKKQLLISQLTSKSIDVAINAIEEIVRNDWHRDGSLNNLRLFKVNLPGIEIDSASFENSDMREANLEDAVLRSANLRWAALQGANLIHTDLSFSDMSNAGLTNAVLMGARIRLADLTKTDMRQANLQNTDLGDSFLQSADLSDADLRGTNLKDVNLQGALLNNAKYNSKTIFPDKFSPTQAGMVEVEKPEDLISFA